MLLSVNRLALKSLTALLAALALACLGGCSGDTKPSHGHGGHHHEPPHGGTAIDLGEEEAHVEFVLDAAAGKLTAYVLKAHMAGFQRITQESLELVATVGGKPETLTLKAVANAATGEKAGDTSQFEAQADWLKAAKTFHAELKSITVRDKAYTALKFNFPKGEAPAAVNK
ncbi:MAG: hypothetical protein EB141_03460 [Verrucomicrobia bacterium]|nr:hypothetical protein [Verrucomicrobiota bacterium]NBU08977.1 hypothetical protein [Pseudomonadota bacterium]NDA65998.1 hypothetical protein [Verrucomicrobiota bacterium]NDB74696.1 hypothetical protein [Verrucomicrobiota bacterium]NDD37843.1 hypothetical protein [Verrucomicrobiota bacterium]